jgi:fatty-acyl-CoA synthase
MRVIDFLAKRALYSPEKTALVENETGRRLSYFELNAEANRWANYLESLGVAPGDRVAVLAGNSAKIIALFYGVMKLGAIFLPLNFRLEPPELVPVLREAEPALLLYSREFAGKVAALRDQVHLPRWIDYDGGAGVERCPAVRAAAIPVEYDAPVMIIYTSGTTGKPKGAVLSHRMTFWNSLNFIVRDLLATDTVLVHTPMFYTGGLNVITIPSMLIGGTVVLMRGWNADEALRAIERERITIFFGVPTQFLMWLDSPLFEKTDLSSLRYVISGGAPMPWPLIERILARGLVYRQGFGLTEVGVNCFALEARDVLRKPGSIGFPNFCIEARVVDEEDRDVPTGEVGELVMRTPAMIDNYWRNPEATAAALRNGWFHTGDLARVDEEGYFYIAGRKKDMFISGGENVYPAEVEQVLANHPAVAEVTVVPVPHEKWGEVGCAVVVPRAGTSLTEQELIGFCHGKLARYKIPKSVRFLSELPRTHSGKVQKEELKRRFAGGAAPTPAV